MSYGQRAVGLDFNPSGNKDVHEIKIRFAEVIDHLNNAREKSSDGEAKRLYAIAITEAQSAQMWAVKAVTWRAQDG
jgi:hypothetical protein